MAEAGLVVDADDVELCKKVIAGEVTLSAAAESVKPRPRKAPATKAAQNRAPTGGAPQVNGDAGAQKWAPVDWEQPTLDDVGVVDHPGDPAANGDGDDGDRDKPGEVLARLRERRGREARTPRADEKGDAVGRLQSQIACLDLMLHDLGLDSLTGKARQVLADDLDRFYITIVWALRTLGRDHAEQS